jgi:hypothetical protein|nr:hypothetical protein [Bacteroides intestinalis]
MEATTPPNTPGFKKKPARKNRKAFRAHNAGYRKSHNIAPHSMPSEATAWLYGSMFLMAAAKILAPLMGMNAIPVQPATSSAE